MAVEQGDLEALKRLLERDSSLVDQRDAQYGGTLLHWAIAKGDVSIAKLLLSKGADTSALNSAGQTPLQVGEAARAQARSEAERARIERAIELLTHKASAVGRSAPAAPPTSTGPRVTRPVDRDSDDLLITGATGTNVADLQVLLVDG